MRLGSGRLAALPILLAVSAVLVAGCGSSSSSSSSSSSGSAKPPVTVLVFPDQNGANLALSSGRAQLVMADSPVAAYAVKQSHGLFKLTGQTYGTAPYGIAIPKPSGLTKALGAAMEQLILNGKYKAILTKWGQTAGAITRAQINAGSGTGKPVSLNTPASLVPSSIKSKGTLSVASDATYAPNEFIAPDGHTVIGMDVDLINALAAELGLKANVKNVTFDSIIPGLQAGKYDLGMSSFTDTTAREKVVDFVTYFSAGTSFYTKASGGTTVNGLADLCGHTVAVEKGTTEQTDAATQSTKCTRGG